MEARELRIGNYVYDTKSEVNIINLEALTYICKEPLNQVKPIPLTEKWLVRFNHTRTYSNKYQIFVDGMIFQIKLAQLVNGKWYITKVINTNGVIIEVAITKIEFVHEYQNLYFALTGEELTIQ